MIARRYRTPEQLDQCVIAALGASNRPLGAYEIAGRSQRFGRRLAPNQVYRILDRLIARGDVQRVELLASYLPARGERGGFMVCRSCQAVESFEMTELTHMLSSLCDAHDFVPSVSVVELSGLCAECAEQQADAPTSTNGSRRHSNRGVQSLLVLITAAGATVLTAPADAARYPETIGGAQSFEERQRQAGDGGEARRRRLPLLHR